jgi:enoyl-CoA hydratase
MIRSEQLDRVTLVRIDRHEQRNALNLEHVEGLLEHVRLGLDAGSRCLVLTGEGTAFCAGADLDTVEDRAFRLRLKDLMVTLGTAPVPVLAAVNGPAIGAGTQLAVSCDLRVGAPRARFQVPMAKLGVAVDQWTMRRAVSLIGGAAVRAMMMGLESFDVERAHTIGLVDRLGDLDDALAWAQEISTLAPLTLRYAKLAINAAADGPEDPEVDAAAAACWNSEDLKEAMAARVEKRVPRFEGR